MPDSSLLWTDITFFRKINGVLEDYPGQNWIGIPGDVPQDTKVLVTPKGRLVLGPNAFIPMHLFLGKGTFDVSSDRKSWPRKWQEKPTTLVTPVSVSVQKKKKTQTQTEQEEG